MALQDYDSSLLNAPGFAMFAKSGGYATPGLFSGAILALGLALARSLGSPKETSAEASRPLTLFLVPALLLLLVVAKSDLKLRSGVAGSPVYFWRYLLAGELHPQWCRHLAEASLADKTVDFEVKVKSVNTLVRKGKTKVFRGRLGSHSDIKRAVVTLEEGHRIDVTTGL